VASLRSYRRPGTRKLSQQARTDIAGGGKSKRELSSMALLKNAMHYLRGHSSMLKDTLAAAKNSLIKMNGAARAT